MKLADLNPTLIAIHTKKWYSMEVMPKIKETFGRITFKEITDLIPADISGYIINNTLKTGYIGFLVVPKDNIVYQYSPNTYPIDCGRYSVRSYDIVHYLSAIMPEIELDYFGCSLNPYYDAIIDEENETGQILKESCLTQKKKEKSESALYSLQKAIYQACQLSEEDRLIKYGTQGIDIMKAWVMDVLTDMNYINPTFPMQELQMCAFNDNALFVSGKMLITTSNIIPAIEQGYYVVDK